MKITAEDFKYRAKIADNITQKAGPPGLTHSDIGVHGTSLVVKMLPYVDPLKFFLIPFAHCLEFGCLKDFWSRILPAKTGTPPGL